MANHKSTIKKARADRKKRIENRYKHKTAKTFVKKLVATAAKEEALKGLSQAYSMIDKLAKQNIIHPRRAAKRKSRLAKKIAQAK